MKEINIKEFSSFSETLEWINSQWVYEIPTLLKVFTSENERGKYFKLNDNLEVESIVAENTGNIVPDIGSFFFLLEKNLSLDIDDFTTNLNRILDNKYIYEISQYGEEFITNIIKFTDNDTKSEIMEIHFNSSKGIMTVVLYSISIENVYQDILDFITEYL